VQEVKLRVAAIVPAYNEEGRIGVVLETLKRSTAIDEIIAVSDGSTDNTYEAAARVEGVKAVKLTTNLGKGGAMLAGANATDADVLVFFDADLINLAVEHVDALVKPLTDDSVGMSIGIFRGGRRSTDWAQKVAPYISGQRALRRRDFLAIPGLEEARFGVEIAIGHYAQAMKLSVVRVWFSGVTHPLKEEKLGFMRGAAARMKMYWEIAKLLARTSEKVNRIRKESSARQDTP
jgi:glycosyltransferase involved in cell wall biosynthesis